jgi:hypothetical protein
LRIRDLFQNGGWRFAYQINVAPRVPSVQLALKADTFKVTPGTPLEIPVTVTRKDGFKEEVTVSFDSLPEGASAEPVKSESKGASAKSVKLELKADNAKPFNGPIRITGRFGEGETVTAFADLTTFKRTTTDIWLTILAKKDDAKPEEK